MANPRLSEPPPKTGSPVVIIVVLLVLAVGAGLLTWVLYPRETPSPRAPVTSTTRPTQSLVEMPVDHPVAPTPVEQDAGAEDVGDAQPDAENQAPAKRNVKRRAFPEGTIDTRRLAAFIRSKNGQVRQCYERRLKQNNLLQGTLTPQIRIHPSGSVMSVSFVQDSLNDGAVRDCVARLIRGWRFPEPEGGVVTISNPYRFSPRLD
jgi:hypothetical protein